MTQRNRRKVTPEIEVALDEMVHRHNELTGMKARLMQEARKRVDEQVRDAENARDMAVIRAWELTRNNTWLTEVLSCDNTMVGKIVKANPGTIQSMQNEYRAKPRVVARPSSEREGGVVPPGKTWVALDVNVDEYVEGEKSIPIRGVFLFNPSTREWITNPGLLGITNNPSEFMIASYAGNRFTGKLYDEFNVAAKKLITDNPDYKTYTEDN